MVEPTQLKHMLSKWESGPNRGENKKRLKPPTRELRFHLQVCICATLKSLKALDVVASPSNPENPQMSDRAISQHPIINQQHLHPNKLG